MDAIKEINQKIDKLFKSETAYSISKNSGIPRQTVTDLMTGKSDIKKAKYITIEKLYEYQKEMEVMKELENKIIDNIEVGEVEYVEGLHAYFIDIDRGDDFDIEFASLNKVDYNNKEMYEVEIHKTYEVKFKDEVTSDSLSELYDAWLEEDQRSETYIESIFFEHEQDAKDYITKVLKGYESFEQCAKAIGIIE